MMPTATEWIFISCYLGGAAMALPVMLYLFTIPEDDYRAEDLTVGIGGLLASLLWPIVASAALVLGIGWLLGKCTRKVRP